MHKIKEHEAYLVLLNIIPKHFNIILVKGYQDDFKKSEDLTIIEQLNIAADVIATSKENHFLKFPLLLLL